MLISAERQKVTAVQPERRVTDSDEKIKFFKVLADSQRRDILIMLRNERLNAGEIAEKLQITPAALSYHLKLLKNADLISEYKEKNFVYYEINTTVFDELIIWVNQFGGKKV